MEQQLHQQVLTPTLPMKFVSGSAIQPVLVRGRAYRKLHEFTPEEIEIICELYSNGKRSINDLQSEYRASYVNIKKILTENGVEIKNSAQVKIIPSMQQKLKEEIKRDMDIEYEAKFQQFLEINNKLIDELEEFKKSINKPNPNERPGKIKKESESEPPSKECFKKTKYGEQCTRKKNKHGDLRSSM
jgi:uncharacterized protein YukE